MHEVKLHEFHWISEILVNSSECQWKFLLPGLRFRRCRTGFGRNKRLVIVTVFLLLLFLFSFLWLDVCFVFGNVRHALTLFGSSFPASVSTVWTSTGRTAFDRKCGFLLVLRCLCWCWETPGCRSGHVH